MKPYPKTIQSAQELIDDLQSKGMDISNVSVAKAAIEKIGYYRLRRYSFQFFDASANSYRPGSSFDDVLRLYDFNCELSALLFPMTSKIEVALRARFCESMLSLNDPLVYLDPLCLS